MERYSAKRIDEMRRMVLPIELRRRLKLDSGKSVFLQRINSMVVMQTLEEQYTEENLNPRDDCIILKVDELGRLQFPVKLIKDMGWEIESKVIMYYVDDETVVLR